MNNNYTSYENYVKDTSYYIDILNARKKINKLYGYLDDLYKALGKKNGPNIRAAIDYLESFDSKLQEIDKYYASLKNSIINNARDFDKTLALLKSEYDGKKLTMYSFDGKDFVSPKIKFDFFASLNINGVTYKASKITECNRVEICNSSGYIKHTKDTSGAVYTLKPKRLGESFDISTGIPNDIIIGYTPIKYSFKTYYTKNRQVIDLYE